MISNNRLKGQASAPTTMSVQARRRWRDEGVGMRLRATVWQPVEALDAAYSASKHFLEQTARDRMRRPQQSRPSPVPHPDDHAMPKATEKLYFDDSYRTQFDAQVLARTPLAAEAPGAVEVIVLDRTCFYPTGGGQPHDLGELGGAPVIDVVIQDDVIHHVVGAGFTTGSNGIVSGQVDRERRADYRAQHHAQHLLSAAAFRLFQSATTAVRLGEHLSTVDLRGPLSAAQIDAIEAEVRRIAHEGRRVQVHYVDPDELEAFGLRRPAQVEGVVRVIEVEDFDRAACGGTHPRTTAEVAPVRIVQSERVRGNEVRLHFLAGLRAHADYRAKDELLRSLAAEHSTQPEQLAHVLRKQRRVSEELVARMRTAKRALHAYWVPEWIAAARAHAQATEPPTVARVLTDGAVEDLTTLARELSRQGAVALLALQDAERLHVVAAAPRGAGSARELLTSFLHALGGKGGGSDELARGSAPLPSEAKLAAAFAAWPSGR